MRHFFLGAGLCGALLSKSLLAQDFTWSELETVGEHPEPSTQLKLSGHRTPSVPQEIQKLTDIAYGEVDFNTDAKGKSGAHYPRATSPWILGALQDPSNDIHVAPVRDREKDAAFVTARCYLIFNPASSSQRTPTSTPRAIQVRSAVYPSAVLKEFRKQKLSDEALPHLAYADLTVDETGAVRDVVVPEIEVAPALGGAVKAAVEQWKFLPARREGVAVAATLRVPVLLDLPDLFDISALGKPPKVIRQERPVYPISERMGGFVGEVTVQFVVTKEGTVRDAFVKRSNNPNFNEPALTAVSHWKFEPGLRDGKPVNTQMIVPMVFDLSGGPTSERYEVSTKRPSQLPEELKNDYPPRVKNVVPGVFPFAELEKGTHATLTEKFAVSPDGHVNFYDKPDENLSDFDYAARAMLEEFEFIPASKNGKPNWGLLKMEVKFDSDSRDVPVSDSARHILRELKKKEPAIFQANQIDQKLERTIATPARYPTNLMAAGTDGEALIEFFVDEEGKVQLPRVISASHPSFGYSGAQAVARWHFKPATHEGKPCIVRARVPVKFKAAAPLPDRAAP